LKEFLHGLLAATRVRTLGLGTIVVISVPSYLVHLNFIPPGALGRARALFEATDVIGAFIVIVIVGGIMSIDRRVLLSGLAKMMVPLVAGSIVAASVGTLAGTVLGLHAFDALFRIVVPILSGGVTAGALPLSIGYSKALGISQGAALALMLPAVILGNFAAIVFAGLLAYGEKRRAAKSPAAFANTESVLVEPSVMRIPPPGGTMRSLGIGSLGAAACILMALYVLGFAASRGFGIPSPLTVLVAAGITHSANILSPELRAAVLAIYRFCIAAFTYPVLFAVGLLLVPWERLIEGLAPVNLTIVCATVGALSIAGYFASRRAGLDPIEGAIVTLTRAAMGGTGDIAVLSAARRLELMPFAQIATRIGGAATVAAALIALEHFIR
jgi:malate:Na+ symporter